MRRRAIQEALIAALDDWAAVLPAGPQRQHLRAVAHAADRDPWRERVRAALAKNDGDALKELADIPGVDPKDIEVHMEKGILSIKGERRAEAKAETDQFTRVERAHGLFYRRFALPDSANPEGITAAGRNGVLEIAIPKRAETRARRIEING